jgi:hypothetical protein
VVAAAEVLLIRFDVFRKPLCESLRLVATQLEAERPGDLGRHLLLHGEDIGDLPVVLLSPELRLGFRIHQLRFDDECIAALHDAAGDDRARIHFGTDERRIRFAALVAEHDRARHDA